jgi:hypothetical protein
MNTTRQNPRHGEIVAALFDENGHARKQWLIAIRRHALPWVRIAVPDIAEQVFVVLSAAYMGKALAGEVPEHMNAYGFLSQRFMWDSGKAIAAIARECTHGATEFDEGSPLSQLAEPDDKVIDEGERLLHRLEELSENLEPHEREAFKARLVCGFDAVRTYERLGLPKGARNAHNNAWLSARKKLAQWLAGEGWER